MTTCFLVSDLHGNTGRYRKLFRAIRESPPDAVFWGGDLLPSGLLPLTSLDSIHEDFISKFLVRNLRDLKDALLSHYPRMFVILGNDDARFEEAAMLEAADHGIWEYMHNRKAAFGRWTVYGYSFVPPTPFQLKDWERYDVSRYVDPDCVPPEAGIHTVPVAAHELAHNTIHSDLAVLTGADDLTKAIMLFHAPPYQTNLDLLGRGLVMFDYAPLDNHAGSIAIRRLIETRQPLLTLHGHIHESARVTGNWRDRIGHTLAFTAAHDGPELALVKFQLEAMENAERILI